MLLLAWLALAEIMPPQIGEYRLAAPASDAKAVYSRRRPHEAMLLVTKDGAISCATTPSARATRQRVSKQPGYLFLATESDPHITPLMLAWSWRGYIFWLSLTKAG